MTGLVRRRLGLAPLLVACSATASPTFAAPRVKAFECTLILDRDTGEAIVRSGTCDQRVSPMSTFKVPLALMGYDAGILTDDHTPTWDYKPELDAPRSNRKPVDPTVWEKDSIVWFSQELTRKLGPEKFAAYVEKFNYGNKDVTGIPGGEDGLTHAWLTSSLAVSPDEQADFIRRLVNRKLPASEKAYDMTLKIIPTFDTGSGWRVHGKTGSGRLRDASGRTARLGWFIGWAERGGRHIVFARMKISAQKTSQAPGPALRAEFLKKLPDLIGEK